MHLLISGFQAEVLANQAEMSRKLDSIIALLKGNDEDTLMLDDIIPDPLSTPEQLDRMGERVKGDPLYKKKVVCF